MVAENLSNLGKGINLQIQEVEQIPNMVHSKKSIPRHIGKNLKNLDIKKIKSLKKKKKF